MKTYTISVTFSSSAPLDIVKVVASIMEVQLESLNDGTLVVDEIDGLEVAADFPYVHTSTEVLEKE